jgi:hypothetical protein
MPLLFTLLGKEQVLPIGLAFSSESGFRILGRFAHITPPAKIICIAM